MERLYNENKEDELMILLFALLFNVLEAVYEALYDRGKKQLSAIFEFVFKAGTVVMCLFYLSGYQFLLYHWTSIPLWKVFVGFVFVRFLVFDVVWNLVRGVKWNFYGTTKLYDRIMFQLDSWGWFMKLVLGIVGICFLLGLS